MNEATHRTGQYLLVAQSFLKESPHLRCSTKVGRRHNWTWLRIQDLTTDWNVYVESCLVLPCIRQQLNWVNTIESLKRKRWPGNYVGSNLGVRGPRLDRCPILSGRSSYTLYFLYIIIHLIHISVYHIFMFNTSDFYYTALCSDWGYRTNNTI